MRRATKVLALAGAVILSILYVACVVWDLLVPRYAMNPAWAGWLPGFVWLTWGSFVLGLAEVALYGALLGALVATVPRRVAAAIR